MNVKKSIRILVVMLLIAALAALTACQQCDSSSTAPLSSGSTGTSQPASTAKPTESISTQPTQTQPTEPAPTEPQPTEPELIVPAEHIGIGLAHLYTQPNAAALTDLYYQVEDACQNLQQELPVDGLNMRELTLVLNCYRQDHPESFWFSRQFQANTFDDKIIGLTLLYTDSDPGSVQFGREALEGIVEDMLSLLQEDMSDYEKALTLYDALIDQCSYVKDAPNAHTVYGALVDGEAVCEGYALAYQYLLMRAGIPAMYVVGYSNEDHAWNAMQLDGQWYYADPTRDDPVGNDGSFRYYGYFALTRELMDWDHEVYADLNLPLPEATSLDCNYYYQIDRMVTDFDREQVMQWMQEDNILRLFVLEQPEDYIKQLRENINSMVIEADLPWYGYVYTVNHREIIVYFY